MKKNFMIFVILVVLLVIAKSAYTINCESSNDGCVEEKIDYETHGLPVEGAEW